MADREHPDEQPGEADGEQASGATPPAPAPADHPGPYPALLHRHLMTPTAPLAPGAAMRVYPTVSPPLASPVPATWAADPSGRHELRWWNGAAWTEHVADDGEVSIDPLA